MSFNAFHAFTATFLILAKQRLESKSKERHFAFPFKKDLSEIQCRDCPSSAIYRLERTVAKEASPLLTCLLPAIAPSASLDSWQCCLVLKVKKEGGVGS